MASKDPRVRGLQAFYGKGSMKPGSPRVTIQAKGVLSLNAASFDLLEKPKSVELLYNPDERVIGIRAVNSDNVHTYQVRPFGTGRTYTISARAFLKFWDIPYAQSKRYASELSEGILLIDLRTGGEDAKRNIREGGK